jgi:low affinity Fe/Cu permease
MENKHLLLAFILSMAVSILVAAIFGCAFGFIFSGELMFSWPIAIGTTLLTFILQQVGGYYWNAHLENKKDALERTLQVQREIEEKELKLPIVLSCAYCRTPNEVLISFDEDNYFECTKCSQYNNVFVQFSTTRITSPPIITNIIEEHEKEEALASISESSLNEPIETEPVENE